MNEVPRPLLDRLETIYMDLPEEDVEFTIMMMERFGGKDGVGAGRDHTDRFPTMEDVKRRVLAPVVDTLPHQQVGATEQDMQVARQEGEHQGHDARHRPHLFVHGDGEAPGDAA